jgi:hypothetical protein
MSFLASFPYLQCFDQCATLAELASKEVGSIDTAMPIERPAKIAQERW